VTPTQRSQRITNVFNLAKDLRGEQRADLIERECADDQDAVTVVYSMLTAHDRVGSGTARTAFNGANVPSHIGKYAVTGEIGSGGFGRVYRALDPTFGRVVAIKVLNAPGDTDMVQRFHMEAKTVANLHHPNIVTVHDFGEDESGAPFLVMEYLDGTTLQESIDAGSLSLLEKFAIMSEVAEGLHYAHERGVVHRDVKPANIMRLADGSVKIMDFGIARLSAEAAVRLTKTGLVVGSLAYMAPEQFSGASDAVSDIFSFGITFYELISGKNPYAVADPAVVMFRITNTDLPPIRTLVPECPPSADRILRRTLARSRDERYTSLADVMVDARTVLVDLRKEEAGRLYDEARQCLAGDHLTEARAAVRKCLEFDPAHSGARSLRADIEDALHRRDVTMRAFALMDQAEVALREQRYKDVPTILTSIRDLNLSDPALQERIDKAAAELDDVTRHDRLLEAAWDDLRNQNITDAFRVVAEAISADAENPAARKLMQEIRRQIAVREDRRKFLEDATRAESLLLIGQTEEAIAILSGLETRVPGSAEASALRKRAESQRVHDDFTRRLDEAKALVRGEQFDQAVGKIDALLNEAPANSDLRALRRNAQERLEIRRRVERLAALKSEAAVSIDRENFDAAIFALKAGLAELGDDGELMDLMQAAAVGKAARRRNRSQGIAAAKPVAPKAPTEAVPAAPAAPVVPEPAPAAASAAPVPPEAAKSRVLPWVIALIMILAIALFFALRGRLG
jgi:serine/threonine protein kinase